MQQPATQLPPGSHTFAGMLAAFTAPAQQHKRAWGDSDVEDDVVSLSYERALRAHARYRSPDLPTDTSLAQRVNVEKLRIYEATPGEAFPFAAPSTDLDSRDNGSPAHTASAKLNQDSRPDFAVEDSQFTSTALDRNLKSTSVTVRLSRSECLQLRQRAGEAGLTVSAYLRSCTFEAESLRALVKETLAKLRSQVPVENRAATPRGERTFRDWLAHLWPVSRARGHIEERVGKRTRQA